MSNVRDRIVKCLQNIAETENIIEANLELATQFPEEVHSVNVHWEMIHQKCGWRISIHNRDRSQFNFHEGLDLEDLNYSNVVTNLIKRYQVSSFGKAGSFWINFR